MQTTSRTPAPSSGPVARIADSSSTRPRPEDGSGAGRPLLVVITGPQDVTGALVDAAGRAAAGSRPLLLAVVRAAAPLTINPVVQALAAHRRARDVAGLTRAAQLMCELSRVSEFETILVGVPARLTRRGRQHALTRRLHALARSLGAELHPAGRPDEGNHR